MEPSGVRLDNRVPETEILVNAGVKDIYLGTCEEWLFRREKGFEDLKDAGVNISMVDYAEPLKKGEIRRACLSPNHHLILDGKDTINRILRDM